MLSRWYLMLLIFLITEYYFPISSTEIWINLCWLSNPCHNDIWGVNFFPCNIGADSGESHHILVTRHFSNEIWHDIEATSFLIQIEKILLFTGFPMRWVKHLYGGNHRLQVVSVIKIRLMQGHLVANILTATNTAIFTWVISMDVTW